MPARWTEGNQFTLLENGEEFFPRVFECIANAQREVVVETFILFEDKVGLQLHEALVTAARRGVQVDVTIDGWGSPDLSTSSSARCARPACGCTCSIPARAVRPAPKVLRRLHRKIVVVDGQVAFIGGINYSADHLADYGPEAKQDWSAEVRGPIVADIHRFAHAALAAGSRHSHHRHWWRWRRQARPRPSSCRRRARRARCWSRATTARTPPTSSTSTGWRSAPRASASSSPTPTSSRATG
jgi:cardiolipin synthase